MKNEKNNSQLSTLNSQLKKHSQLIKVCGMREPENIRCVEALDVDCLGFIFYDRSPRYVPDRRAYIEAITGCKKIKVGVFVNESVEMMIDKGMLFKLNIIQLHGDETPDVCCELGERGYAVIKAFPIASATDFQHTALYRYCCDYFLFDTKSAAYGGSGSRFDWHLLDAYQGETPFLLSGGLTPDCVDEIKHLKHPQLAGIDLNSGFEISPALKDTDKLEKFIEDFRCSEEGIIKIKQPNIIWRLDCFVPRNDVNR